MVLCKLFSLEKKHENFLLLFFRDYPIIFDWECVKYMMVNLCPSIIECLKQFDILYPHIKSIQFNMGK
jgi:hypothetical protein